MLKNKPIIIFNVFAHDGFPKQVEVVDDATKWRLTLS